MSEDERFSLAVERTLGFEGGYANDADDPGGETNFGISRRSYPDVDIRGLTREGAIAIYRRDFWDKPGFGRIESPAVAAKVFDMAVNMGAARAVRLLQQSSNDTRGRLVAVDGVCGAHTVEAVNARRDPGWLVDRLRLLAAAHYLALGKPRYLAGWLTRALS